MSKSKYFFFNGSRYFTESELTILSLVEYFNYNTSLVVLEHNNLICKKKTWDQIYIRNHDNIEIVTIVGGG
jgi:thiamine biosynthesis protein ThiS